MTADGALFLLFQNVFDFFAHLILVRSLKTPLVKRALLLILTSACDMIGSKGSGSTENIVQFKRTIFFDT